MSSVEAFNPANLAQYENPYTSQVTQATQNLLNEQNAEQFNQANASAASAGAFGGDRQAVLQAQMAQQQQLAEAPTLANLQSQGFTTAAGLLGQQQNLQLQGAEGGSWLAENAAAQEAGLGSEAQNALLSGASSELQTGALEQQLQQEELNVPEEQFLQQQAYPYQATDYLAGLVEGAAPGGGGMGSTTSPGPSTVGEIAGLGLTGLGLANQAGLFGSNYAPATSAITPGLSESADAASMMDTGAGTALTGFFKRGGRLGFPLIGRAPGGLVPGMSPAMPPGMTPGDLSDVQQALSLAAASPIVMPATGGAHGLPFSAPQSVQTGAGGGNSTAQTIGTLADIAGIAVMAFSDPALKHERGETSDALGALRHMHVGDARYLWDRPGSERPMLMADSVERGAPHAVAGSAPTRAIKPLELIPLLVQGVKELDRRTRRRAAGGRLMPGHHHHDVPRMLADGGDGGTGAGSLLDDPLVQVGAGMLASRSPFPLQQLGEGLEAGIKGQQAAEIRSHEQKRVDAPRIDTTGGTMRLVYPDGRVFDTGLGN